MISKEAVEVAARAMYEEQMEDGDTEWEVFVNVNSSYLDYWRDQSRAALEAAAPYLMTQSKAGVLEEVADKLAAPRKVWSDSVDGVVVMDEGSPATFSKLPDWLRAEAANYRGEVKAATSARS